MQPTSIADRRHFNVLLVLASVALSVVAILRDPIINDDGVFYLMLAREAATNGIAASFALFDRPLYPILIALLHQASGLPLLAGARLLDAALLALLVVNFTRFAVLLCGERSLAPWIALLVLLFPQLNEYRSFLVRDFGFWALLFGALVPLLRYQATQRWQHGLAWAALGAGAAAFRPEALLYLLLLPLACLRGETKALRAMSAARLYACIGVLVLPPVLVLARFDLLQAPVDAIAGTLHASLRELREGFAAASSSYAANVLDARAQDFAPVSLAAGLLAVLALKSLAVLGPLYCIVLGWGIVSGRAALPAVARGTWRALLAIALLIVGCFVLGRQFVTGRYVMMPCLLALVPAALALRSLSVAARQTGRERTFLLVAGIAIVLLLVDGFVSFGPQRDARPQAIAWMRANLPAGARVFGNDRVLDHYSGGEFVWDDMMLAEELILGGRAPLAGVDYWILRRDAHDRALDAALAGYAPRLTPLGSFGDAHRRIEIYRVAPSNP
ncbi:MAG: hypothetical protein CALGDGBN_00011 [Pseudomonadales bacterium]|nr:hypothetical protein [Pseudomonadales bacterium]